MAEAKTYTGGCHCGAVRYQAVLNLSGPVLSCNCSMCGRAGTLLTFVPAAQFTLLSGDDSLTNYFFNKHAIHHLFCKVCGIKSFARGKRPDGAEMVAINARCLDDVDVSQLTIQSIDGKSS
jgi:hypothetical protein